FADNQISHSGRWSARIDRPASSTQQFSTISATVPIDFVGNTIIWQGWIRRQNVSGYVALWAGEADGCGQQVQFSTMEGQNVGGTADWTQFAILIPLSGDAKNISFGFFLAGGGQAWVDDLELLVDGVPVAQAKDKLPSVLDTDHQFDNGSLIQTAALSDVQIANLSTLGKVWGFVKYHHPAIVGGHRHWDYELFRVIPQVLAAPDRDTANSAMLAWIANLGPVAPCTTCVSLGGSDIALAPDLDWLTD